MRKVLGIKNKAFLKSQPINLSVAFLVATLFLCVYALIAPLFLFYKALIYLFVFKILSAKI